MNHATRRPRAAFGVLGIWLESLLKLKKFFSPGHRGPT